MVTYGSLFSGYGGLDMGVQAALGEGRVAWVSDIEPGPQSILAHHYPEAQNLGDVTAIDWAKVEPVDVLTGGSPCQDLSMAGQRAGMRPGTRSGLWESMFTAIKTIRPRLVVWENVRGALSADAFSLMESREGRVGDGPDGPFLRALGRVLGDLASVGYDAQWVGIRASDVGAPHGRFRIFVAAYPHGSGWEGLDDWASQTPPERHGHTLTCVGDDLGQLLPTPTATYSGNTAENHLSKKPGSVKVTDLRILVEELGLVLLPTPQARDGKGVPGGGFNTASLPREIALLPTPTTVDAAADGPSNGRRDTFGPYADAIARWEAATGREAPAPTEITDQSRRKCNVHGEERRSREELHRMREATDEETIRERSARGQGSVHEADSLLPGVREHQGGGRKGHASLASEETPKGELPGVRISERPARPSHGQEPGEQRSGEPDDTVRVMPPETPLAGGSSEKAGSEPVGETCICKHRLSAKFVEFLMGLPDGWVTDISISRTAQLRALGNGVVPQQAEYAIRLLLGKEG